MYLGIDAILAECLFDWGIIDFYDRGSVESIRFRLDLLKAMLNRSEKTHRGMFYYELELFGSCLHDKLLNRELIFTTVAGLPELGSYLLKALCRSVARPWNFRILDLTERASKGQQELFPLRPANNKRNRLLLIDCFPLNNEMLVTWINKVRENGWVVEDVLALVEYEPNDREYLESLGCNLHSVFTAFGLLKHLRSAEKI